MANYKSKEIPLNASAEAVFNKLSNLAALRDLLDKIPGDKLPDDKRAMFENLTISDDSITIPAGPAPVGNITLKKDDCINPTLIKLVGIGTPVPLALMLAINPISDNSCSAQVIIDIEIPMLIKPMVSGPLNKLIEQIANFLPALNFND